MTKDEALRLALEALEYYHSFEDYFRTPASTTITAIKTALEAKDEPEGLRDAVFTVIEGFTLPNDVRKILETAYYNTTPPQRTWVGLTDDEMLIIYGQSHEGKKYSLGRMIETILRNKNDDAAN